MIKCKECGAEFDESLPKCPYCLALNYSGANKEYMDKLSHMNATMNEMYDDVKETYIDEMKHGNKFILKVSIIAIVFIALIVSIVVIQKNYNEKKNLETAKAQYEWNLQYIPQLDSLYEAGKYDEIATFFEEHYEDPGYNPYNWQPYTFIDNYICYQYFKTDSNDIDISDLNQVCYIIFDGLSLSPECYSFSTLTKGQQELTEGYYDEVYTYFKETLHLSDTDLQLLYDNVSYDSGFFDPSYPLLEEYLEAHWSTTTGGFKK